MADALAGDDDRALREILGELIADLARQERALRRREDLTALLASDEDALRPEHVAALVRRLGAGTGDAAFAAREGELLEVLAAGMTQDHFAQLSATLERGLADSGATEQGLATSRRFEALADAAAGDPEVALVAEQMARLARDHLLAQDSQSTLPDQPDGPAGPAGPAPEAWRAYRAARSPAQRRCLDLLEEAITP